MCAHVIVQEDLLKFPKMLASPAATPEKAQELHPQFSQNTISVKGCLILGTPSLPLHCASEKQVTCLGQLRLLTAADVD